MKSMRAVFAGSTSLVIDCAEAFRSAGHGQVHLITDCPAVQNWADKFGLSFSMNASDTIAPRVEPFDFLFCLDDGADFPAQWVEAARTLAAQLHLSLEPPYGRAHAPSWAILDQKLFHGITWRDMRATAGQADIICQLPFSLSRLDTAGSVYAKCHEAGLTAFISMIEDLGGNALRRHASGVLLQALKPSLPMADGTIDFSRPASDAIALVSALDLRPLPNDFVRAKVFLGDTVVLAGAAVALPGAASGPPGYIVHADSEILQIAAVDHDVAMKGCLDVLGQPAGHLLTAGTCLPQATEGQLQSLMGRASLLKKHEAFWRKTFADIDPIELPYPGEQDGPALGKRQTLATSLPLPHQPDPGFDVGAAFCAWLSALTSREKLTVLYTDQALALQTDGLEAWLSRWVPLTLTLTQDLNYLQVADLSRQVIAELEREGPYLNDLPVRLALDVNSLIRLSKVGLNRCNKALPANMILMLSVDGQQATLVADAAAFSPAMLQTMAGHFSAFTVAWTQGANLVQTPLIPAGEAAVVQAFNSTATDYDARASVYALIAEQALRTPDHPAVCHQGITLSYGELEHRANALAGRLQWRGVQTGDIIGVCLGRGLDIVVAMLAVLKTGAAYLPLDPDYPQDRLRYMVDDSQTRLVLTTRALAAVTGIAPDSLCLIDLPDASSASAFQSLPPTFVPHAAYLMYTSGSTGRPKGVLVTHQGLVNLFAGLREVIPHEPGGRWLAVTSFSFDISVAELWWPLTLGFTVMVHPSNVAAASAAQALVDHRITHLFCTPSMVAVLMADSLCRKGLSQLSVLMAGGEVFPLQLTRELCGLVSGKVFNVYGPTEISVLSNICELSSYDEFVPLGSPITNTTVWLKTAFGAECPAWVAGELLVGGDGVSDGYWRQPELTSEKFIADPARPGGRLYRTGDLARRRPDGQLEFVGRIDHQVKIRGHRIELGEVEKTLAQLPGVSEAVVLAPEDRSGDRQLVAYVVPQGDARLEPGLLQKAVAAVLPATMVPTAFQVLRAFPLTANGKIDRPALLTLTTRHRQAGSNGSTNNSLEDAIATIWAEALGTDHLGAAEDFFSRGGTFSQARQTLPRLQAATGHIVALPDMVRFSSIRGLAHKLAADASGLSMEAVDREAVPTLLEAHTPDASPIATAPALQDLNAVESMLADIWRELFAVPTVRGTDDFFALGGSSLTAVRMFALLRRQIAFDLPLAALFEAPRMADFAALLSRSLHPSGEKGRSMRLPSSGSSHLRHRVWSPLVAICQGDARHSPLFCVHGAGGNVFNFKALSLAMGPHRTVYALQPQGVDGHLPVLESIEAMATQYVAAMREVDGTGPYHLIGYSAGGVIAFEMAQQLKKTGAKIALLAMIDTLTPEATLRKRGFFRKLWLARSWRFQFVVERYRQRKSGKRLQDDCPLIEDKLHRGEWLSPELTEVHLFNRILQAQNRYAPERYTDGILLFQAEDATTQFLQGGPHMGWDAYVEGAIRVFRIPGSHNSMMQSPGLQKLTMILDRELVQLDSTGAVASPVDVRKLRLTSPLG